MGGGNGGTQPPTFDVCKNFHSQWDIWQNLANQASKEMLKHTYNSTLYKHFQQIQQKWQLRISAERSANPQCSASWQHGGRQGGHSKGVSTEIQRLTQRIKINKDLLKRTNLGSSQRKFLMDTTNQLQKQLQTLLGR